MNVMLKSFSEDVTLSDPKNPQRFLVFEADGEEFRVPVGGEAISAIAKFIFKRNAAVAAQAELPEETFEEPLPEDASQFGGDVGEGDEEFEDEEEGSFPSHLERVVPESEDEVPSL
jgi:hypothetical protein